MPIRRPRARCTLAVLSVLAAGVLTGCGSDGSDGPENATGAGQAQAVNPYAGHAGYADPGSKAAQAAKTAGQNGDADQERVFTRLARTPQGIWLTPEEYPPGSVGAYVRSIVEGASRAGQVPTFVVYGIPDRDCSGGHSAGGLSRKQYGPWVGEIADAVATARASGLPVVAVLEPDALPSLVECGDRDERVRLLGDAAGRLAAAGITTYLDGGHSHWIAPAKIARLLEEAGIDDVRGFSTNVSNFQTDQDETAYAENLVERLGGGVHYIVDTGRNGFGATSEWCNPPGRAFGTDPGEAVDDQGLDAYVWVKPPGESDGECHGGPPAGRFWPERAMELAAASGW